MPFCMGEDEHVIMKEIDYKSINSFWYVKNISAVLSYIKQKWASKMPTHLSMVNNVIYDWLQFSLRNIRVRGYRR